jgi:hypothetical protein
MELFDGRITYVVVARVGTHEVGAHASDNRAGKN